jgi:hypothetical protein
MNELIIHYKVSKMLRIAALTSGYYFFVVSLSIAVYSAVENRIDCFFYLAIAGIVLSAVLICFFSFWQPKPLVIIGNDAISVHFPDQKLTGDIDWKDINRINIGISYLKIRTVNDKVYAVDLNDLKYMDLKAVKSKIVEICESKNIRYEND